MIESLLLAVIGIFQAHILKELSSFDKRLDVFRSELTEVNWKLKRISEAIGAPESRHIE